LRAMNESAAIQHIWSAEEKYLAYLRIEVQVCEALARRTIVPWHVVSRLQGLRVDPQRILQLEKTLRHEMIAFLAYLEEMLGTDSRYVHIGLTSSDVVDTATALQLVAATNLLISSYEALIVDLDSLARRSPQVGNKEDWRSQAERNMHRLCSARKVVAVGKLSGAVGTFAHTDIELEEEVCDKLGLAPELVATQIVQRDRHAEYLTTMAVVAATMEQWALSVLRDVNVANPDSLQLYRSASDVCSGGRLVRRYGVTAVSNIALWHERDISHSSVERLSFPDVTVTLAQMIADTRIAIELVGYR
jgi:adenylosuccinate lyase